MLTRLALVGVCVLGGMAAGCRDDTTPVKPKDFAVSNADLSGTGDMAGNKTYIAASPNDIDTNTVGGNFGKGVAVKLTGLIAITAPNYFKSSGGTKCTYQVFVQDPKCSTPPCGIVAEIKDQPMNAGKCDFANVAMTALMPVKRGDKLDIQGSVDSFTSNPPADAGGGSSVTQHILAIDSLTDNGAGTMPAAMEVTDGSMFTTYVGSGWATYEGTYVRVKPSAPLMITSKDSASPFHYHTSPGSTDWGDDYRADYNPKSGTALDTVGLSYTSISGVVSTVFGGVVLPVQGSDFVP